MQRLAMTDELTGIHNRRQIQAKGRKWFTQAREEGKPLCVLLDVDHFKKVNERPAGPPRRGQGAHRRGPVHRGPSCAASDRVGRNGGEEFLVLLPDALSNEAVEVAARIRQGRPSRD